MKPMIRFFFTDYEHNDVDVFAVSIRAAISKIKKQYGIQLKCRLLNYIIIGNRHAWNYSTPTGYSFIVSTFA